jgi:NAD(P)H-dependent flavin oxidoreductase YrpB (nitropropane dioxygenase family)
MLALHTRLCDLLAIEYPIIQAGMGRAMGSPTTPGLVAAVSEAGGMGCLGAAGLVPGEIRAAIREIKGLTSHPFGVGLLLPASLADADITRDEIRTHIQAQYPRHWQFVQSLYERYGIEPHQLPMTYSVSPTHIKQQVASVLEEGVPVFVSGLGDPAWVVPGFHAQGTKVMGLAGSVRNAERQKAAGVDVVIVQGYEAGGHTGQIASLPLIPQVVDAVSPLPVVAAGGIGDGRGVAAALALGAQGVWCGTAFLYALEADLASDHRRALTRARSEDLVVSKSYTGKPSRIVRTEVIELWAQSGLETLPMPHQFVLMDDFVYSAEVAGRADLMNSPAGQVAGMLTEHVPAAVIVRRLVEEAVDAIARMHEAVEPTKKRQ